MKSSSGWFALVESAYDSARATSDTAEFSIGVSAVLFDAARNSRRHSLRRLSNCVRNTRATAGRHRRRQGTFPSVEDASRIESNTNGAGDAAAIRLDVPDHDRVERDLREQGRESSHVRAIGLGEACRVGSSPSVSSPLRLRRQIICRVGSSKSSIRVEEGSHAGAARAARPWKISRDSLATVAMSSLVA